MKAPRWEHEVRWRTERRRCRAEVRQGPEKRGGYHGWVDILIWTAQIDPLSSGNAGRGQRTNPRSVLIACILQERIAIVEGHLRGE